MSWRRLKMQLTGGLKAALFYCGFFCLLRFLVPNKRVAILRYHAVVDAEDNYYASPGICLSVEDFERHVAYFSRRYRVVSMEDIVNSLLTGKALPRNAVAFTFDDGYADNFRAARILKRYGATGMFYLTTDCLDRKEPLWLFEVNFLIGQARQRQLELKWDDQVLLLHLDSIERREDTKRQVIRIIKSNGRRVREQIRAQLRSQLRVDECQRAAEAVMLTWQQVHEMIADRMEVGGHTLSHLNLPNAAEDDARHEIAGCRQVLEERVGHAVRHFSVPNSGPYPYYNDRVKRLVKNAGFVSAVTSAHGFVDLNSDLLALRRIRTVPELHEVVATLEFGKLSNSAK